MPELSPTRSIIAQETGRGIFVTGTDTGVGKSVVSAALVAALRERGTRVGVMKPIETGVGPDGPQDARWLHELSGSESPLEDVVPYTYSLPAAPSVASGTTELRLDRIKEAYQRMERGHEWMIVEGCGGALVPLTSKHTVADLIRLLGLPALVVARAGLGTLNHTMLTVEALQSRGIPILGVILNEGEDRPDPSWPTNAAQLEAQGLRVLGTFPGLKRTDAPILAAAAESRLDIDALFAAPRSNTTALQEIDRRHLWHPFTQMADWMKEDPVIIESGNGVWLRDTEGREYIDGTSSIWLNVHGHRHPSIDRAIAAQLSRIAHSTMLGLGSVPAIELAERLVAIAPEGLTRIFYSDNGSTAVEAALKMSFQYWHQVGQTQRRSFLCLEGAYHGDTLGSVSVGGIGSFHRVYQPLLFETVQVGFPMTLDDGLAEMERALVAHAPELCGVILEPLVQGAAGLRMMPDGYLKGVRALCDRYGVHLILDEVATGFGRTGTMFACEQEGIAPDLMAVAKGITGGYLPLAATFATEEIYGGFLGDYKDLKTFFHGHSYTGNPLACAAAIANLAVFEEERTLDGLQPKIARLGKRLEELRGLRHVGNTRQKGFIAGIELMKNGTEPYPWEQKMGIKVCMEARRRGAMLRPIGNVLVVMPPLAIGMDELDRLVDALRDSIVEVTDAQG